MVVCVMIQFRCYRFHHDPLRSVIVDVDGYQRNAQWIDQKHERRARRDGGQKKRTENRENRRGKAFIRRTDERILGRTDGQGFSVVFLYRFGRESAHDKDRKKKASQRKHNKNSIYYLCGRACKRNLYRNPPRTCKTCGT